MRKRLRRFRRRFAKARANLRYRFIGRRVRTKACELAAMVLSTRKETESLSPLAFSLAVFFELYIMSGASAVAKDFGPKGPVKLREVRRASGGEIA